MTATDVDDKYQKLSVEFAKLRNQIPSLRDDLEEEKKKNKLLKDEIRILDIDLRKSRSENESLLFRNEQLLRRIEALQANLDSTTNAFAQAKAKKKHKEANLRLFGAAQLEAGPSNDVPPNDPKLVLEQELERKLTENAELHSTIYDMEKQHETVVTEFSTIVRKLEAENEHLKKALAERAKMSMDEDEEAEAANGFGNNHDEEVSSYMGSLLSDCQAVVEAMARFFGIVDNRSVIYPCDATLESVPQDIHLFGLECGKLSESLEDLKGELAALQLGLKDIGGIADLKTKLPEIRGKLGELLAASMKEIQPLLKTCQRKECDAPWCNANLDELNGQYEKTFIKAFTKLSSLLLANDNDLNLHDTIIELKKLFHRFRDIVGKKIFIENHLPTTSKKLKGYNESMEKTLLFLVQIISKLQNHLEDKGKAQWLNDIFGKPPHVENGTLAPKKMSTLQKQASIIEESNTKLSELKAQLHESRVENESYKAELNEISKDLTAKNHRIEDLETRMAVMSKQMEILKGSTEEVVKLRASLDQVHTLDDYRVVEFYFLQEVSKVVTDLNQTQSKVHRYRRDIDDLTMVLQKLDVEHNEAKKLIDERENECQELRDELETTRQNYEDQLKVMTEHLAILNAKIGSDSSSTILPPPPTSTSSNSLKDNLRKMVRK